MWPRQSKLRDSGPFKVKVFGHYLLVMFLHPLYYILLPWWQFFPSSNNMPSTPIPNKWAYLGCVLFRHKYTTFDTLQLTDSKEVQQIESSCLCDMFTDQSDANIPIMTKYTSRLSKRIADCQQGKAIWCVDVIKLVVWKGGNSCTLPSSAISSQTAFCFPANNNSRYSFRMAT